MRRGQGPGTDSPDGGEIRTTTAPGESSGRDPDVLGWEAQWAERRARSGKRQRGGVAGTRREATRSLGGGARGKGCEGRGDGLEGGVMRVDGACRVLVSLSMATRSPAMDGLQLAALAESNGQNKVEDVDRPSAENLVSLLSADYAEQHASIGTDQTHGNYGRIESWRCGSFAEEGVLLFPL